MSPGRALAPARIAIIGFNLDEGGIQNLEFQPATRQPVRLRKWQVLLVNRYALNLHLGNQVFELHLSGLTQAVGKKMLVVGLHPSMHSAHTLGSVIQIDVSAWLWRQACGLCKVGVKRTAIPPAVYRWIAAYLPAQRFFDKGNTNSIAESLGHFMRILQ